MAKKYISDILREVKDTSESAAFLEKLADAIDNDKKLSEAVKKATDTLMPAGVIRGSATMLKNYSKYMEESVTGLQIDWPPQPALPER